jgi:hypothetical protein
MTGRTMNTVQHDPYKDQRKAAVPGHPLVDPADWGAEAMATSDAWRIKLNSNDIKDLHAAVAPFDRKGIDVMPLGKEGFALPHLAPKLAEMRGNFLYGRGFVLLRGLSVDAFGKRGSAIVFWAIGQHLSDDVLSQNKQGHVLGHVTNLGQSRSNPSQRGPYPREEIPFHVDCADIVGLLCMEVSKSGGKSSLVSSVAVYNEMLKRRPDLVGVLCKPLYRYRRDEVPPGMGPWYQLAVFHFHQGYFSASIEPTYISSTQRFDDVPEMTPAQKKAMAMVQSLAEELRFDTGFHRGDMQFCNNHVTFHTRRAYQDHEDPVRKRHLLRLWLKALDGRPLPEPFYERHGSTKTVDRPGGIVGPNTALNTPIEL